jgi:adenylate cyclase
MEADEEGTLAALKAHRAELIDPEIARRGGRIVKSTGDGLLIEFESVVEAVRCAVATQQGVAARNESMPEDKQLRFRIGVNLGDVIVEDDGDIHGDGVNVAARLEAMAEPGSVFLAGSVREQTLGKLDAEFADLGEHKVKNISRPIRVFAWPADGAKRVTGSVRAGTKPTVALGAIEAAGKSEDAAMLAAATRDAVEAALSNQTGIVLKTDPASAEYLAHGSVQVLGSRYRAAIRIVDQRSGELFATERLDGAVEDLFDAQDELALRVTTAIRFGIYDREIQIRTTAPLKDQNASDLLTYAGNLLGGSNAQQWLRANEVAAQVLELEPANFMALAIKALSHTAEVVCGYREADPAHRQAGMAAIRRAIEINERSDFVHFAKAAVHSYLENDLDAARGELERALELNPYYPLALSNMGEVLMCEGRVEEGIDHCTRAFDASPRLFFNHRSMLYIAQGHFARDRYRESLSWCRKSDQQVTGATPNLMLMAASATQAGDKAAAEGTAGRLLRKHPEIRLSDLRVWRFHDPAVWARFVDGLRQAGLPE